MSSITMTDVKAFFINIGNRIIQCFKGCFQCWQVAPVAPDTTVQSNSTPKASPQTRQRDITVTALNTPQLAAATEEPMTFDSVWENAKEEILHIRCKDPQQWENPISRISEEYEKLRQGRVEHMLTKVQSTEDFTVLTCADNVGQYRNFCDYVVSKFRHEQEGGIAETHTHQ